MRMWSLGMAIGLRLKLGAVILLAPFVTLFPGSIYLHTLGYTLQNKVTKVTKGPSMTNNPYAIPEPDEPQRLKLDALRYLQMIYRDPQLSTAVRMRAAGLAIPYEVPKLAVTAVVSEQDFATVLDRRLKRIEEMKLLENKVVNGGTTITDRTIDPGPTPAPPMPAPLNRIYNKRRYRRI